MQQIAYYINKVFGHVNKYHNEIHKQKNKMYFFVLSINNILKLSQLILQQIAYYIIKIFGHVNKYHNEIEFGWIYCTESYNIGRK